MTGYPHLKIGQGTIFRRKKLILREESGDPRFWISRRLMRHFCFLILRRHLMLLLCPKLTSSNNNVIHKRDPQIIECQIRYIFKCIKRGKGWRLHHNSLDRKYKYLFSNNHQCWEPTWKSLRLKQIMKKKIKNSMRMLSQRWTRDYYRNNSVLLTLSKQNPSITIMLTMQYLNTAKFP